MIKKIAILTSGGDAPGMNAAVRACILAGLNAGKEMYVVYDGYLGLVERRIQKVTREFTKDIIGKGGTIIRSARLPEFKEEAVVSKAVAVLNELGIDALIGIGGDGTYRGLALLAKHGIKVVGIPGTIDNDVGSTQKTLGFATSLSTICECVDRLKDTSGSHQRCALVEVMGRNCGDLAMYAAVAEGVDGVICPERPLNDSLLEKLREMKANSNGYAVVLVSENYLNLNELAKKIEAETGFETKSEVLGRLQRGGSPVAEDRILAARFSAKAVELLVSGEANKTVGIWDDEVIATPIEKAVEMTHVADQGITKLIDALE